MKSVVIRVNDVMNNVLLAYPLVYLFLSSSHEREKRWKTGTKTVISRRWKHGETLNWVVYRLSPWFFKYLIFSPYIQYREILEFNNKQEQKLSYQNMKSWRKTELNSLYVISTIYFSSIFIFSPYNIEKYVFFIRHL